MIVNQFFGFSKYLAFLDSSSSQSETNCLVQGRSIVRPGECGSISCPSIAPEDWRTAGMRMKNPAHLHCSRPHNYLHQHSAGVPCHGNRYTVAPNCYRPADYCRGYDLCGEQSAPAAACPRIRVRIDRKLAGRSSTPDRGNLLRVSHVPAEPHQEFGPILLRLIWVFWVLA